MTGMEYPILDRSLDSVWASSWTNRLFQLSSNAEIRFTLSIVGDYEMPIVTFCMNCAAERENKQPLGSIISPTLLQKTTIGKASPFNPHLRLLFASPSLRDSWFPRFPYSLLEHSILHRGIFSYRFNPPGNGTRQMQFSVTTSLLCRSSSLLLIVFFWRRLSLLRRWVLHSYW